MNDRVSAPIASLLILKDILHKQKLDWGRPDAAWSNLMHPSNDLPTDSIFPLGICTASLVANKHNIHRYIVCACIYMYV